MSTKIYDAYKFHGKPVELLDILKKYRSKWKKYQVDCLTYLLERDLTSVKSNGPSKFAIDLPEDKPMWKEYYADKNALVPSGALDLIREQTSKPVNSHSDYFDIKGSVVVYLHKNNVYFQLFLSPKLGTYTYINLPNLIEDDTLYSDFHYQNQTDPWFAFDNELTKEERTKAKRDWSKRKKVWNEIFSEYSSPDEAGLIYEFHSTYTCFCVYEEVSMNLLRSQGIKVSIT